MQYLTYNVHVFWVILDAGQEHHAVAIDFGVTFDLVNQTMKPSYIISNFLESVAMFLMFNIFASLVALVAASLNLSRIVVWCHVRDMKLIARKTTPSLVSRSRPFFFTHPDLFTLDNRMQNVKYLKLLGVAFDPPFEKHLQNISTIIQN